MISLTVRLKGMVSGMWVYGRAPLNSQWPVLKNGGTIVGLLILCSKNILDL